MTIQSSVPRPTTTTGLPYHPKIDRAGFSDRITNPYMPLRRGSRRVFVGTKDGAPERVEVTVTRGTRTIMGVRCVVVRDVVTTNYTLAEKTTDWYAQDAKGNVWYFGEDSKDYRNGVVVSTQGTWEAGVDGAQPGIIMQARPRPGRPYRQEYRPGVAEDMGRVLRVDVAARVPAGSYRNLVLTEDTDPLNPDKLEHKWYARGVGVVHAVRRGGGHREEIRLSSTSG